MPAEIIPELRDLIDPLKPDERKMLEESILAEGVRDPIVVWGNVIVDGHNRYEIATNYEIPYKTVSREFETINHAKCWMIDNQYARRNLTDYQRGRLALKKKPALAAMAKENQGTRTDLCQISDKSKDTKKTIASEAGISHDTLHKIETIERDAEPELKEACATGAMSINAGKEASKLPAEQQREVVRKVTEEAKPASKAVQEVKTAAKKEQQQALAESLAETSTAPMVGNYTLVYADPPWRYDYSASTSRDIENQYPTMSLEDICELPVADMTADDCVLFMWATSPKLAEAMRVIECWGFKYKTSAIWDKEKMGLGYYFRQQHELLLVCTKGSPGTPEPADRPRSIFTFPRGEHSAKPLGCYGMLETMYPSARRVELFCRSPQDGWSAWGNQSNG